jgi:hypothetical protein
LAYIERAAKRPKMFNVLKKKQKKKKIIIIIYNAMLLSFIFIS